VGDDGPRRGLKPPASVLAAFGAAGVPEPLAGGQGSSWRVGDLVLKPLDMSEQELRWLEVVLGAIRCDGFRVAPPLRARDGSPVVEGWTAWRAVEGGHEERRWPEIVAVGERFHAALAGFERPAFIDRRTNPWAIGERVAWGELPAASFEVEHLPRLAAALRPVTAPSQLVHTDLTGNVLFHDRLPPAVIDFSASWRPTAYASAVVVADALVWEGADDSLLDAVAHVEHFEQFLLRALIFRAVVSHLFRTDEGDPYLPAVELACRLAGE
jgi:uncharacterized protein (TIGR02569 family)